MKIRRLDGSRDDQCQENPAHITALRPEPIARKSSPAARAMVAQSWPRRDSRHSLRSPASTDSAYLISDHAPPEQRTSPGCFEIRTVVTLESILRIRNPQAKAFVCPGRVRGTICGTFPISLSGASQTLLRARASVRNRQASTLLYLSFFNYRRGTQPDETSMDESVQ